MAPRNYRTRGKLGARISWETSQQRHDQRPRDMLRNAVFRIAQWIGLPSSQLPLLVAVTSKLTSRGFLK